LRVADLNGDGKVDLIASAGNSAPVVLLGNGDGTFTAAGVLPKLPADFAIEDFDEDDQLDLAHFKAVGLEAPTCALHLYVGNGDATFLGVSEVLLDGDCGAIAAGDLDQDGDADLVTTDRFTGSLRVLLGNGDGSFVPGTEFMMKRSSSLALYDFDGDERLDVAASGHCTRGGDNFGKVLLGNGDGTFASMISSDFGHCTLPTFGKVNRDSFLDVLARRVGFGRGDGGFSDGLELHPSRRAVDFNRDGLVDLAIVQAGWLDVFIGQGDGTFKGCSR
jgi:hypothetical protein